MVGDTVENVGEVEEYCSPLLDMGVEMYFST